MHSGVDQKVVGSSPQSKNSSKNIIITKNSEVNIFRLLLPQRKQWRFACYYDSNMTHFYSLKDSINSLRSRITLSKSSTTLIRVILTLH